MTPFHTFSHTVLRGALPFFLTLTFSLIAGNALAGDWRVPTAPPVYKAECGSCHTAYPPGLMLDKDWRKTLAGLSAHFGTDASLTASELKDVSNYLLANAATDSARFTSRSEPPRLTQSAWFERKHVRKLPDSIWKDPKVKSAANCSACHTRADLSSFAEGEIAVPGFPGKHW